MGKKKNGDPRNHQNLPPTRGVGYLYSFQGCLIPYTKTGTVQEISEISCTWSDIPVQRTAIQFVHSTHGVHCSSKGRETDGHTQGYKNPPVPRRVVGESHIPPGLSGEFRKIGTGTKTGLRPCRLPVRPCGRSAPTYTRPLAEPLGQNTRNTVTTGLSGPAVHVSDRFTNSHRKASSPRSTS